MRKKLIIFIILAVLLVVGIVLAVNLPNWLSEPESNEDSEDAPIPEEGEGFSGNALLLYPEFSQKDIKKITIKNSNGEYTLVRKWIRDENAYRLRLEGYENIPCNLTKTAIIGAYVGTAITHEPIRNATKSQMESYGVTEETCQASYTVTRVDEKGKEYTYTVLIGDKAMTSANTYYASVVGRDVIYRIQAGASGVSSFSEVLFAKNVELMDATIYAKFQTQAYALAGIESFRIFTTSFEDSNGDDVLDMKNLVEIMVRDKTEDSATFDVLIKRENGSTVAALADVDFLSTVFETLYTEFTGEAVCDILTSETDLSKYGLAVGQKRYYVSAVFSDKDENGNNMMHNMEFSMPIDGYCYTRAAIYDPSVHLIIKLPYELISFLDENDERLLESYTATDSAMTGFFEYLNADSESGAPGIKKITIKTKNGYEVFNVSYDNVDRFLSVITDSGKKFEDIEHEDVYERNQFANLYTLLLMYPMPRSINTMTEEEIAIYKKDENIAYELIAERNDGVLLRYTYYQMDANFAIAEYAEGKLENGIEVWEDGEIIFDTTMEQIRIVTTSFETIINGGKIRPDEIIY
ncbi:MAG: hypothetical protein IJW54_04695 [Clostridia bacterium]|nr:hypothetical protein [Clostridia bacterium]